MKNAVWREIKRRRKTFNKKKYFQLLQIIFLGTFIFFIILGIWGIFYEDDMPLIGFFWAGIVAVIYWFIQKILSLMFHKKSSKS